MGAVPLSPNKAGGLCCSVQADKLATGRGFAMTPLIAIRGFQNRASASSPVCRANRSETKLRIKKRNLISSITVHTEARHCCGRPGMSNKCRQGQQRRTSFRDSRTGWDRTRLYGSPQGWPQAAASTLTEAPSGCSSPGGRPAALPREERDVSTDGVVFQAGS